MSTHNHGIIEEMPAYLMHTHSLAANIVHNVMNSTHITKILVF